MSFHVEIDIANASVLILGGGNVALRKAKQCLEEGANIFVLSKDIKEEFRELSITIVHEPYHKAMLSQYLFCIACTSDKAFNEQVFADAKKMNCLYMGVHQEDASNMRPMVSKDFDDFQIAVSTKGKYPAMTSNLVDEAGAFLQETQGERLRVLSSIRKALPNNLDACTRQKFCRLLLTVSYDILLQIKEILSHDCIRFLCYHGVKDEHVLETIKTFETLVQQKHSKELVCSAYISQAVCKTINAINYKVFELGVFLPYFHQFHKTIILQPMLFQKGAYFDLIQKWDTYSNVFIEEPMFSSDEAIEELCECISSAYASYDQILVCYHSSKDGDFCNKLKRLALQFPNLYFSREVKVSFEVKLKGHRIFVLSLYMLTGKHSKDTVERVDELRRQGYEITYLQQSMIELECMRDLLIQKIL